MGDAFVNRVTINPGTTGKEVNPFIAVDYGKPYRFEPSPHKQRGVGFHPHKGFETVTFAYKGELSHRDTFGGGGTIGTGGVQWMTAGSGVMHEEKHSQKFSNDGGELEMLQLWINLRAKDKGVKPNYQSLTAEDTPTVPVPDGVGTVRVVAGDYNGTKGPASTHSPIDLWDVYINKGRTVTLDVPEGWVATFLLRKGKVEVDDKTVEEGEQPILTRDGARVKITALDDVALVWMAGEPIDEPVVAYGPFIMNTQEEIMQAFADFEAGKFGEPPTDGD